MAKPEEERVPHYLDEDHVPRPYSDQEVRQLQSARQDIYKAHGLEAPERPRSGSLVEGFDGRTYNMVEGKLTGPVPEYDQETREKIKKAEEEYDDHVNRRGVLDVLQKDDEEAIPDMNVYEYLKSFKEHASAI